MGCSAWGGVSQVPLLQAIHPGYPLHCCCWLCAENLHIATKKLRNGHDSTDTKGTERNLPFHLSSQHLHRAGFGGHHFLLFLPLPDFRGKKEQAVIASHKHTPSGERLLDVAEQDVWRHIQDEPLSSISLWMTRPACLALLF